MPEFNPTTKLSRAPEVLFSPLTDDEGVLLSMEAGLYYSLNRTAVAVWHALETECTLERLADHISRDFKVTPEQAQIDLRALLPEMLRAKVILHCGVSA